MSGLDFFLWVFQEEERSQFVVPCRGLLVVFFIKNFCFCFVFRSLICISGCAEDTFVRKNIRKTCFPFVFPSLICIFASEKE